MTFLNLSASHARSPGRWPSLSFNAGFMPMHVFLRIFLSALAAVLAVHFWKHRRR